jgi:hypothetical protein
MVGFVLLIAKFLYQIAIIASPGAINTNSSRPGIIHLRTSEHHFLQKKVLCSNVATLF